MPGTRARGFRGESDFRKPPCRNPFGGSVHLRMPFQFQVLVVRGLPVGIDQNVPIRDGWGIPDVLRVEFGPAVGGPEIGFVTRQFVHFEQVDPFRGESRPEEKSSGFRIAEIGGRRVDASADVSVGSRNGFFQVFGLSGGPVKVHGIFPCAAFFDDIQIANARGAVLLFSEGEQVRGAAFQNAAERRQFRNRTARAVHTPGRVLDVLCRIGTEEQLFARQHVFVYRQRPFEKHFPVVVQGGDFQRIET